VQQALISSEQDAKPAAWLR